MKLGHRALITTSLTGTMLGTLAVSASAGWPVRQRRALRPA